MDKSAESVDAACFFCEVSSFLAALLSWLYFFSKDLEEKGKSGRSTKR